MLEGFGASKPGSQTPHAQRWYNHISSFSDAERKALPGEKKVPAGFNASPSGSVCSLPAKAPAAKPPANDDDDVDLFGSDDEEVFQLYFLA